MYDDNKNTINVIDNINDVHRFVNSSFSDQGTGGMQSKLEAALIAQNNHIESWIVNGHEDSFLLNAFGDRSKFSRIVAAQNMV